VGGQCWGGDRAGVGARQKPAEAAAVVWLRRRRGLDPNNKWHLRVLKGLWKECVCLLDRGKQGGAQLDGGGAGGAAAGQWLWEEGRARGIYRAARHWVMAANDEDAVVARPPRPARVRRHAADGPVVRGAHTDRYDTVHGLRVAGRTSRSLGAWARGERRGLGRRAASGSAASGADAEEGGAARAACATSRRDDALAEFVLLSSCLNANNSKFLNRIIPNFECESWRSHTHLQLSQRLYGVFLNRFCRKGLPTLNATQSP
jgi:hypothetical protein